ncbi:mitochondrial 37S ribosomal protein NAM9 [Spizellomyces punctatus DAOM BR117]|uniref:RNA-binding S4 domain-containing protein n=1 Tax=Spizellomyces punctatus (strain DAOM BR117) TaxID=645134 RepID=A0A0L0HS43_SPIPD|nr:mitochondrial 37S ribosomal protein NAM9 [Spizellomyces punctatus DAOM BR117]KND04176.1 hypothetical protein SPPG_01609 [Spizellomyces punctatus DAOM BR117]|eukprot:XP_016612215.1 hypothetical protein SPPG_01609 [Spizellomyces punctatus DAOM BR117]
MPGRIIRWKVKDPFDPNRALIRMSWNKYNLYALATRNAPEDLTRKSVFQQKWTAKRELRAYHVPNITERQLIQRHWSARLPLQQMTQAEKDRLPPVQALAFAETERRLDVVVFRSHFASSIWQARSFVIQGHVKVNGKPCAYPARSLEDGDMVTVDYNVVPTIGKDDSGKPIFKRVDYMAPWMFLPAYLEVDYQTCSTVFLRTPLPQPDQVEVPSPFPPDWHQLVYEWYSSIYKKKLSVKTNPNLQPPVVIEGQTIKLKPKFAEIRRRDDKEAASLRKKRRNEREEAARATREAKKETTRPGGEPSAAGEPAKNEKY